MKSDSYLSIQICPLLPCGSNNNQKHLQVEPDIQIYNWAIYLFVNPMQYIYRYHRDHPEKTLKSKIEADPDRIHSQRSKPKNKISNRKTNFLKIKTLERK